MKKTQFEWDEEKDRENREKHNVSFSLRSTHSLIRTVSLLKMSSIVLQKIDIIALDVLAKGL